jgi:hypothetical protein
MGMLKEMRRYGYLKDFFGGLGGVIPTTLVLVGGGIAHWYAGVPLYLSLFAGILTGVLSVVLDWYFNRKFDKLSAERIRLWNVQHKTVARLLEILDTLEGISSDSRVLCKHLACWVGFNSVKYTKLPDIFGSMVGIDEFLERATDIGILYESPTDSFRWGKLVLSRVVPPMDPNFDPPMPHTQKLPWKPTWGPAG